MQTERDVYVPMRDGVHIAMDIYRPDGGGRHPVVLVRTPYIKNGRPGGLGLGADGRPYTSAGGPGRPATPPAPLPPGGLTPAYVAPFVEAGFTVVVSDTRGTGYSEGEYDLFNFDLGPMDGYDTVEWIASESWCDGNVGIMGNSASGVTSYQTAINHPPHLKAMAPGSQTMDAYLDAHYPGGVYREEFRVNWGISQMGAILPLDPGDPSEPGYERKRALYETRFKRYYDNMKAGKNPIPMEWLTATVTHDTHDAFWQKRDFTPDLGRITIPVLQNAVWYDHFIRGAAAGFEGVAGPKRFFVAPGGHGSAVPGDDGLTALQVRWFEYFLRGIENGVLDEPQAHLYLLGEERWVDEPAWPVPATEMTLYFASGPGGGAASRNDGLLLDQPAGSSSPDELVHDPANPNRSPAYPNDQRSFEPAALTFSTLPLEEDLEVIGKSRLLLYASTDAKDVDWCVRMCDVFPDGRARMLNFGVLKGSHILSHENPVDLERERVYEFDVEVWHTANVFKKGHRIRIDICNSDYPMFASNPLPSRNVVFHDAANPSRLVMPVVRR